MGHKFNYSPQWQSFKSADVLLMCCRSHMVTIIEQMKRGWGINIQKGMHEERVWQGRGRWCKKDEMERKFKLLSWCELGQFSPALQPMWWWGKQILSWTQKNRQDSLIWDEGREQGKKTDTELTVRLTKKRENTGHWAKAELNFLEGCQLYLLFCQQTMTALDCQGWMDHRHRIQNKCVWDSHSQARVKDFGEMSSVSIVVLSEPQWGQIEARKKSTLAKYRTFVFMLPLFRAVKGRKGGDDIDFWLQREKIPQACCSRTVCLCVSREVLWRISQFSYVFSSQTWSANVLRKPRWCARPAVYFYELLLEVTVGYLGTHQCLRRTLLV